MRSTILRGSAIAAGLTLALGLAACSTGADAGTDTDTGASTAQYAKDESTIVLGMVPDQESVENNFQPMVEYIEHVTGKEVELIESANYAALVEAAIAGRIDMGTFSGFTYVAAQNGGANLIPIGVQVTEEGEEPGYESVAVAAADSDIETIEDFAGRNVCFVDPGSTSGYLYPSATLLDAGIDPEDDITPVFAGGHDASAQKTAQGVECEAGFAEDAVIDSTGVAQGLFAEGDLKVIERTVVPGAPVVMSGNLPQDVQDELREQLQGFTIQDIEDAGIEVTDAFRAYFYELVPVEDSYYDSVRLVCDETGAPQCDPANA